MKGKIKTLFEEKLTRICLAAAIGIGVCSTTGCGTVQTEAKTEKNIVVLENQQKEINDVLAIKKIDTIEHFAGRRWLSNGKLLGIQGMSPRDEYKGIPNFCLYDEETKELKKLTSNTKRNENVYLHLTDITKDETFAAYCYTNTQDPYGWDNHSLFIMDLKSGGDQKIDDGINAVSKFTEKNKLFAAKGMKVYSYDLDGRKTEIILPEEFIEKMNDFSRLSFEEYVRRLYEGESESPTNEELKRYKEKYEYRRSHNCIQRLKEKDDKLYIETYNKIPFIYNLKTNVYKETTKDEVSNGFDHKKTVIEKAEIDWETDKMWELDADGNRKKIIEKVNLLAVSTYLLIIVRWPIVCMMKKKNQLYLFMILKQKNV
jgi:hypothetical protein